VLNANSPAEARLQQDPIARRQYPRRFVGADRDAGEQCGRRMVNLVGEVAQSEFVDDVECLFEAAGAGDRDEFDSFSRVARLHPGLAVVAVVEHRDCQIRWPLHCDRRERTKPISISPSPVTTRTRRSGWAIASPSPIIAAAPIAPQR